MCDKCIATKEIIESWLNCQGHDRCWYYPDLFNKLAEIHDVKHTLPPNLPSRKEFEEGCKRYQDEQFKKE